MSIRLLIPLIILFDATIASGQIDFESDPSVWPDPFSLTMIQRVDSGYTHEKVLEYLEWKEQWERENLPPLYLFFDPEKERKMDRYWYGGSWNYEISFDISPNLIFYVHDRPDKSEVAYIEKVSADSLQQIPFKDGTWLRESFEEDDTYGTKCLALDRLSSEVFVILKDPDGEGYLVMKPINCIEEFE